MTRERSNRHGLSERGNRRSGVTRDSTNHRNSRHPHNSRTNSYVVGTLPLTLPNHRAINRDNTQNQLPCANNSQSLSVIATEADNTDVRLAGSCPPSTGVTENVTTTGNTSSTHSAMQKWNRFENSAAGECGASTHQLTTNSRQSSQPTSQSSRLAESVQVSNYSTVPNNEVEINVNSCNGISSTEHGASNADSTRNTNVVPDSVSGYTVTELPRHTDSSMRHERILMMDNSVVSGYNNNRPSADQCQFPILTESDILGCLSPENPPPRPRRGRRHRQRRRRRRHRTRHHGHRRSGARREDETYIKPDCCSSLGCKICLAGCLQFKKVLVFFASFGVICVLIGIVLGVLRAPGNSFFTLSLMFVGLGLILLTMVLIGWKCTPTDHEPCHMLFSLGMYCSRTRRDRRRRDRNWFGRRMNPEFRYRAPPPSYATAMQDYRNELRHLESTPYVPGSPPPSYKSHTTIERPGIHIIFPRNEEFPTSNPPTYRLQSRTARPSLAILNDGNHSNESPAVSPRFSVSSTAALVESEQVSEPLTASGIVNMSFSGTDHTVEMYPDESTCRASNNTARRPTTTDGAVQTDDIFHNLSQSVAIILEDGNVSTL